MRRIVSPTGEKLAPAPMYGGFSGKIATVVDSIVSSFAPQTAHRMRQARMQSAALLAYEAARITRVNPKPKSGSADGDILPDLQTLRDKSRTMVRDDAHAAAAARVFTENVIGKGLTPQSTCTAKATGLTEEQVEEWRNACEEEFARWSEEEADATGYGTFADLQRLAARALMTDGEAIGHAVVDGLMISCELIDPDRLESPSRSDSDQIRGGVELGTKGQPVAYHILRDHPADFLPGRKWGALPERITATDGRYRIVQHLFARERPGQTRGVPWLASALPYAGHLHHYLNSELIAARVNSNVAMFVKRAPEANDPNIMPSQNAQGEATFHESIEPGTIEYLNEGEEIQPFTPNRPGNQFEPFVMRILRAIWAAPGLSYELVTKDFGGMNYSSARALLLECRRGFDSTRTLVVRQFCIPWWGNVIQAAIAAGRLVAPPGYLRNPRAFLAHRWVSPAYGWVDPTKEIDSSRMAIDANLSTPYDEAAKSGFDAEEVADARGRFLQFCAKKEKQYGLAPGTLTRDSSKTPATQAAPAEPPPGQPNEPANP